MEEKEREEIGNLEMNLLILRSNGVSMADSQIIILY